MQVTALTPPRRLIIVSTDIPHAHSFAGLSASMMTLFGYIEHFAKAGWPILHLILSDRPRRNPESLAAYKKEIAQWPHVEVLVWEEAGFLQPRSRSYQQFRSLPLPGSIETSLKAFQPDAIFCLDVFAASVLENTAIAPVLTQVHDPKFQTLWYHALYEAKEHPRFLLQLPINYLRSHLWAQFYKRTLRHAARVITVAKSTEGQIKNLGVEARYVPMAWPEEEGKEKQVALRAEPSFLFLGNLSGLGSRSALHFLLDRLYPHLVTRFGEGKFTLFICGAHTLPKWVKDKIAPMREVQFLGFVDDLASLMRSCHGVLAPMDVKVGNRTRIITAMALGVPVIAHSNTALGNPALVDSVTCYLANDPVQFAERMERAFRRGPEVLEIIQKARIVFDTQFRPDSATELLAQEIQTMISHPK